MMRPVRHVHIAASASNLTPEQSLWRIQRRFHALACSGKLSIQLPQRHKSAVRRQHQARKRAAETDVPRLEAKRFELHKRPAQKRKVEDDPPLDSLAEWWHEDEPRR